jgi:hypothetical protein
MCGEAAEPCIYQALTAAKADLLTIVKHNKAAESWRSGGEE